MHAALHKPLQRWRWRLSRFILAFVSLAWLFHGAAVFAADAEFPEYKLKAAFLFNFAKFLQWPGEALPATEPLVIAVIGENPFDRHLDDVIKGKLANGHPVVVQYLSNLPDKLSCHILFVPRSAREKVPEILRITEGRAIVTVSEYDGFCQAGGLINLRVESQAIRFDLNIEEAQRANISLSGRLSGVATLVKTTQKK